MCSRGFAPSYLIQVSSAVYLTQSLGRVFGCLGEAVCFVLRLAKAHCARLSASDVTHTAPDADEII